MNNFIKVIKIPIIIIAVLWAIHLVQFFLELDFGFLGVRPRDIDGLGGIITAPLIHQDFKHLISNSVPLFVLTTICTYFYPKVAFRSFTMIYILSGIAVWLLARSMRFHIGISGVVYGLVAFVFWNGIFRKSLQSIILALIVTILYSGYFAGIVPDPDKSNISWESHLLGALVGIFTSYYYKEELEEDETEYERHYPEDDELPFEQRPYFLDRDTFEKTKQERKLGRHFPPDDNAPNWTSTST